MMHSCNLQTNILEINSSIFYNLCKYLDDEKRWESLMTELPHSFSQRSSGTSAKSLLMYMGNCGINVGMLIKYLENLDFGPALLLLKKDEPLKIVQHPESEIIIEANSSLKLTCRATGFPTPQYQWFKEDVELLAEISSELFISSVSSSHNGMYCCRVYNWNRQTGRPNCLFSGWCNVRIEDGSSSTNFGIDSENSNLNMSLDKEDLYFDGNNLVTNTSNVQSQQLTNFEPQEIQSSYALTATKFIDHSSDIPEITLHPVIPTSENLKQGSSIILSCKAKGYCLSYQWLKDGHKIPGETRSEISLRNLVPDHETGKSEWYFNCVVYNPYGSCTSKDATIKLDRLDYNKQYSAEDKVALIIVNDEYDCFESLIMPSRDAISLCKSLKSLDFKVLTFRNLTLNEMKIAVDLYCKFLQEGSYGIFYYGGHGYQDEQCYLMPVDCNKDCDIDKCLGVWDIISNIEKQRPALNAVLIDCCRRLPQYRKVIPSTPGIRLKPEMGRNIILGFSTSFAYNALDNDNECNGYFVKYLVKHIEKRISVQDVLYQVQRDFEVDPIISIYQIPWINSSLTKPLSLQDPKVDVKNTNLEDIYSKLTSSSVSSTPFELYGFNLSVCFQREVFCNELTIHLSLEFFDEIHKTLGPNYKLGIAFYSNEIKAKIKILRSDYLTVNIESLQRIEHDVIGEIRINRPQEAPWRIPLHKPFIAKVLQNI